MVRVLGFLHGKPHQIVARGNDVLRGTGGEAPRQIVRADGSVFILALQLDPYFRAFRANQVRGLPAANQGHIMPRHQQLGAEKGAVGRAKDKNFTCHVFVFLNDSLPPRLPLIFLERAPRTYGRPL